jgi:hypothetical protein
MPVWIKIKACNSTGQNRVEPRDRDSALAPYLGESFLFWRLPGLMKVSFPPGTPETDALRDRLSRVRPVHGLMQGGKNV